MEFFGLGVIGSPPLTREPLLSKSSCCHLLGITPAYAGTTNDICKPYSVFQDHPRLRGNHRFSSALRRSRRGSPPLTREPLLSKSSCCHLLGITPAYAGTTSLQNINMIQRTGSPPLTREPRKEDKEKRAKWRITPAYAGTTLLPSSLSVYSWDHPRLRGNHLSA